ncbi:hypothetical protein V7S74_08755 [Aquirufa sp. 2-AUSEE-184A6]|jgi:hypothetical protein|uniref:Uncharacterized protein n=1 Tax=Aquirufa novilacunae TaxID=3139305 RepID=A0ABW8SWM7_9BACT
MGIISFLKSIFNKQETIEAEYYEDDDVDNNSEDIEDSIPEPVFVASQEEINNLNKMENKINLKQSIIDEIDMYTSKNLESEGFQDCISNNDLLNRDNNISLIKAGFKNLLNKSIADLDIRVFEIKQRIKTYESAGMTESITKFSNALSEYELFADSLKNILNDEVQLLEKLNYCILSYEIGFTNGLRNNDNELI